MMDNITEDNIVETEVRGVKLRLVGYTRALKLCARMNRETEVLDFIDRIKEGEVLYDLGAAEGRFALYAALHNIRCYAFEPESMNFQAMLQNIALNGEKAKRFLIPLNYALGERGYKTTIKIGQPWAGGHHRVLSDAPGRVDLNFEATSEQAVEVVSLDEFIEYNNLPLPNYMKVDIDGSELPFLQGANNTLKRQDLTRIIFELYQGDASYNEVTSFLDLCGFSETGRHEVEPGLFNIVYERRGNSAVK